MAVHLDDKGRGRALRHVWSHSDAAVLAYMDVDLSTDLAAVLPLVAPVVSGHSDMAIGTRLAHGSRVVRGTKREVISRCYNLLLHTALATGFSDAQCGFKAIRADRARALLPLVEDTGWFFDTELLFLAERAGMRIHEVPVDWVDDPDSRVDIVTTAVADLKGVARLVRALLTGSLPLSTLLESTSAERAVQARPGLFSQLARFSVIGVVSTVAYVLLYLALRTGVPAQGANALALVVTAVANTAVNRRADLRGPHPHGAPAPPAPGPGGLRGGPPPHRRRLGRPAPPGTPGGSRPRGRGARHRRRRRHRRALRALPLLGVPRSGPPACAPPAVTNSEELTMTTDVLPLDAPVEAPTPDAPPVSAGRHDRRPRSRVQRLWRGRPEDPPWVRPALLTLLVGTAVLYLWDLGASGWANSFYSAAVQAGTKSWKAFFFGSSDAANFITVDKPPASLWVMELSARVFGVNSWSILVPQALEGVAAVACCTRPCGARSGPAPRSWPVRCSPLRRSPPSCSATTTPTRCWCSCSTVAAYATVRALERAGTGGWSSPWRRWAPGSSPRCCRPSWSSPPSPRVPVGGADPAAAPHRPAGAGGAGARGLGGMVGGGRAAHRRPPTGPTSAARRTTACST